MKLTSENVETVFMNCLFKDDEDHSDPAIAEGIMSKVGFHKGRLESHSTDIEDLLFCLPEKFHKDIGGGWSFLNACEDKNGHQWTSFHQRMEQLFQLGLAIGKVECLMPRDMWKVLPGEMPYYVIM